MQRSRPGVLLLRVGALLLPIVVLLLVTLWAGSAGKSQDILWLGTGFQVIVSSLYLFSPRRLEQPLGRVPLMLYLIALGWIWMGLGTVQAQDWYLRLAQAVLLVAALILFGLQVVADSGARELHQAYLMAQRLADRQDWPSNLEEIKDLPDVKAFRAMLKADVTPAFALLRHESAQVRLAALAALEYHRDLRPGQAELLLEVAQQSPEPEVRAAAISALANVTDRTLGEKVAAFMRDPSSRVRRAANEALLWDTENRWIWLREPVRRALSDPALQDDGPLIHHGPLFCTEAINDLQAWTAETGALAMRASLTLVAHYERALNEKADQQLIANLRRQVSDMHAPVVLRIGLTQLLAANGLLDKPLQEKLLDPMNAAPLRLIAAEALLSEGEHAGAITALRDIARLPNREIALATADVVQRRLGVDLGLKLGEPMPPLNSRQAADVTRRVMKWAHQGDDAVV